MLKQLLNVNNGLLLILTPNNTDLSESDLSLLSVSATTKKCDCNFLVKIKVLNFKIKFSEHLLKFSKIREFKKC